jgi:hypothetical protein
MEKMMMEIIVAATILFVLGVFALVMRAKSETRRYKRERARAHEYSPSRSITREDWRTDRTTEADPPGQGTFVDDGMSERERHAYASIAGKILQPWEKKPIRIRRIIIDKQTPENGSEARVGKAGSNGSGKNTRNPRRMRKDKFSILLGYAPSGARHLEAADTVFNQRLVWEGKAFSYTGLGTPISDDDGNIVAEYTDEGIYFLVDPKLYGASGRNVVFSKILARVVDALKSSKLELEERFVNALAASLARSLKEKTPKLSKKPTGQNPINLSKDVGTPGANDVNRDPVARWQRIEGEARAAEQTGILLRKQLTHEIGREYDLLCALKKVTAVKITAEQIELRTTTLYCKDRRKDDVYEIGRFKIIIPFDSAADIVWTNLTRLVDGRESDMMAPHISGDGTACLGNTSPWFRRLIRTRRFSDAAKLAIAFVETANPKDASYDHLDSWPLARATKKGNERLQND